MLGFPYPQESNEKNRKFKNKFTRKESERYSKMVSVLKNK